MRATGIVRRMDDLGRVVIPKAVREQLHLKEGMPFELFIEGNGVYFKPYNPDDSGWDGLCNTLVGIDKSAV